MEFHILIASEIHLAYASQICDMIEQAAKQRGTGIAKRSPEYIQQKMHEGKAVIALQKSTAELAGFCYIETWGHGKYVVNSGLIVNPNFRQAGLAKRIKTKAFKLSRSKYPDAKLFGLTTSLPVMKINSELGYKPVTFSELTDDEDFWKGCQSCVNYDIQLRTNRKHCLCTGMLFDPKQEQKNSENKNQHGKNPRKNRKERKFKPAVYARWMRLKKHILLRNKNQPETPKLVRFKNPFRTKMKPKADVIFE